MRLSTIANQNFRDAFKKLLDEKVPLKVAFKLQNIARSIDSEFTKYEEARVALVQRLADRDDKLNIIVKDGQTSFSDEAKIEFTNEINALLATEVSVPILKDWDQSITTNQLFVLAELFGVKA